MRTSVLQTTSSHSINAHSANVRFAPGTDQQRPPNSVLLTWTVDPNPTFGAHKSSAILVHATSITASISTLILKGNEAIPTAQRACRPRPWRRSSGRHGLGEHAGHQPARQGARPHDTGIVPAARRLGDRIKQAIAAVHESVHVR